MISDERKLKRGLKDISPLFHSEPQKPRFRPVFVQPSGIHCISVLGPGTPEEILTLNYELATKFANPEGGCSVLSLFSRPHKSENLAAAELGAFSAPAKTFWLSGEEFESVCSAGARAQSAADQIILVNFNPYTSLNFEKVIPVLDKAILLLRPDLESLSGAYKLIKASMPLNPRLEYYVICDSRPGGNASQIFERFSELAARRLQADIAWLGSLRSGGVLDSNDAVWNQFFLKRTDTLEKRALGAYVQGPVSEIRQRISL